MCPILDCDLTKYKECLRNTLLDVVIVLSRRLPSPMVGYDNYIFIHVWSTFSKRTIHKWRLYAVVD